MEISLPGLRPFDQNLDPSDHSLIGHTRRDVAVMFDLAVEFDALLTHFVVPLEVAQCRWMLERWSLSSPDRRTYEGKIVERFGGRKQFEFITPPPAEMKAGR